MTLEKSESAWVSSPLYQLQLSRFQELAAKGENSFRDLGSMLAAREIMQRES